MKIAFISYEYPGDTGGGGIGTYIDQASQMLASRRHHVEVFCGTNRSSYSFEQGKVIIHRVKSLNRDFFSKDVLPVFRDRHLIVDFDIVEGPEYKGDSLEILRNFPMLPHTVKLHTPSYLVKRLNNTTNFWDKLRFILGSLKQGKLNKPFWVYEKEKDVEYLVVSSVKVLLHPSVSIASIVKKDWDLAEKKFLHLPNIFNPSKELLNIPLTRTGEQKLIHVLFLGRLEKRKGIFPLLEVIELIAKKYPQVKFTIAGASMPHPRLGVPMSEYISTRLAEYRNQITLPGALPYGELPHVFKSVDICIFPSLWENFPNVCLEAMASGKAIVGSPNGGMADMLEDGKSGFLVGPQDVPTMVKRLGQLIENPELRVQMGEKAREKVLLAYSSETIGQLTETIYQQIIEEWN